MVGVDGSSCLVELRWTSDLLDSVGPEVGASCANASARASSWARATGLMRTDGERYEVPKTTTSVAVAYGTRP